MVIYVDSKVEIVCKNVRKLFEMTVHIKTNVRIVD